MKKRPILWIMLSALEGILFALLMPSPPGRVFVLKFLVAVMMSLVFFFSMKRVLRF